MSQGAGEIDTEKYREFDLMKRLIRENIYPRWQIFLILFLFPIVYALINSIIPHESKNLWDSMAREDTEVTLKNVFFTGGYFVSLTISGYLFSLILAKVEFGVIASLQADISSRVASEPVTTLDTGYNASQMFFMTEAAWRLIEMSLSVTREAFTIVAVGISSIFLSANAWPLCILCVLIYGALAVWYMLVSRTLIMGKFDGMRGIIDGLVRLERHDQRFDAAHEAEEPSIGNAIDRYRQTSTQLKIIAARLVSILRVMSVVFSMGILMWGTLRTSEGQMPFGTIVALEVAFLTFSRSVEYLASACVTMGADLAVVKEMYRFFDASSQQEMKQEAKPFTWKTVFSASDWRLRPSVGD